MKKNGISLIVLVITIIIMIILASAIILSITSSDIVLKGKQAVLRNDLSATKERVSMLKTERMIDQENATSFSSVIPDEYKGKMIIDEFTGEILDITDGEDPEFEEAAQALGIRKATEYVKVGSWSQLVSAIEADATAKIILTSDINLTSEVDPIPYFNGILEGNYKSINNLVIDDVITYDASSIVDYTKSAALLRGLDEDGVITNLTINNADVKGYAVTAILIGLNCGSVINCRVSGVVAGTSNVTAGLVGYNAGKIINNSVDVVVQGKKFSGGITGYSINSIYNTNVIVNLQSSSGGFSGGFVGLTANEGVVIKNCSSQGEFTASGQSIGGFVGQQVQGAKIVNSYSTVNVTNNSADWAGGFAGSNHTDSIIEKCYSTGSVSGVNNVGGFVGINTTRARISDSYATGGVTATGVRVGGFCGRNNSASIIENSFSIGRVASTSTSNIGGFVGLNSTEGTHANSSIINCYYNKDTSNQTRGYGSYTGTLDLKELANSTVNLQSSYQNLDFVNVWEMGPNHPLLRI